MDNQIPPSTTQQTTPVIPPDASNPPQQTKQEGKKNWVFLPLYLLILAAVCAGVLYFTLSMQAKKTTPAPTSKTTISPTPKLSIPSDWVTYTNDQLGFSAQFPSDWYDNKTKKDSLFLQTSFTTPLPSEDTQPNWDTNTQASLQVITIPTLVDNTVWGDGETPGADLSVEQFKQLEQEEKQNGHKQLPNIVISGYPATVYDNPTDQTRSIYIESKKILIILATPYKNAMGKGNDAPAVPFKQYEKVFYQILSTFKFLDQSTQNTKGKCPCWDSIKNVCLPQSACQ